ncbi:MAG: hypothetical protein WBV94_09115 [Blastocatellia bacterium]
MSQSIDDIINRRIGQTSAQPQQPNVFTNSYAELQKQFRDKYGFDFEETGGADTPMHQKLHNGYARDLRSRTLNPEQRKFLLDTGAGLGFDIKDYTDNWQDIGGTGPHMHLDVGGKSMLDMVINRRLSGYQAQPAPSGLSPDMASPAAATQASGIEDPLYTQAVSEVMRALPASLQTKEYVDQWLRSETGRKKYPGLQKLLDNSDTVRLSTTVPATGQIPLTVDTPAAVAPTREMKAASAVLSEENRNTVQTEPGAPASKFYISPHEQQQQAGVWLDVRDLIQDGNLDPMRVTERLVHNALGASYEEIEKLKERGVVFNTRGLDDKEKLRRYLKPDGSLFVAFDPATSDSSGAYSYYKTALDGMRKEETARDSIGQFGPLNPTGDAGIQEIREQRANEIASQRPITDEEREIHDLGSPGYGSNIIAGINKGAGRITAGIGRVVGSDTLTDIGETEQKTGAAISNRSGHQNEAGKVVEGFSGMAPAVAGAALVGPESLAAEAAYWGGLGAVEAIGEGGDASAAAKSAAINMVPIPGFRFIGHAGNAGVEGVRRGLGQLIKEEAPRYIARVGYGALAGTETALLAGEIPEDVARSAGMMGAMGLIPHGTKGKDARPDAVSRAENFPVNEIHADPERFQFKAKGGETTGASGTFGKDVKFTPDLVKDNPLLVWQDSFNKKFYVVDGHNRLNLAKRNGVQSVPVEFVNARTAEEARAVGAVKNILAGNGSDKDASTFFQESKLTREDVARLAVENNLQPLAESALAGKSPAAKVSPTEASPEKAVSSNPEQKITPVDDVINKRMRQSQETKPPDPMLDGLHRQILEDYPEQKFVDLREQLLDDYPHLQNPEKPQAEPAIESPTLEQVKTRKTQATIEKAEAPASSKITDLGKFKKEGLGTHFETTPERWEQRRDAFIENPLELSDIGNWRDVEKLYYALRDSHEISHLDLDPIISDQAQGKTTKDQALEQIKQVIKDNGFDGIVYQNPNNAGRVTYIAFDSHQLRPVPPASPTIVNNGSESGPKPELTAEQKQKLREAERRHDQRVEFFKRGQVPELVSKQLKGEAMRFAAEKRQITDQLTAKEQARAAKREASNYIGKKVVVDGKPATVEGTPFGKVKVKFEDGKTRAVAPDEIGSAATVPEGFTPGEKGAVTIRTGDKLDFGGIDHFRSPLSNLEQVGAYERRGGQIGRQASDLIRQAQIDIPSGAMTQKDAVKQLAKDLKPIRDYFKANGKPGLAQQLDRHIINLRGKNQPFENTAALLKSIQYNTKLRFNPKSRVVNELQPLATLWPHVSTKEFVQLEIEARKPATQKRLEALGVFEGGNKAGFTPKKSMIPDFFGKASNYNRAMGYLHGEIDAARLRLTGSAAHRHAMDWAKRVEFDSSKWDAPPILSGPIASVLGQFKGFTIKNIESITNDLKLHQGDKFGGYAARAGKRILAQLLIGGVRSIPGVKQLGGVLIVGAVAKALTKAGMGEDKANKAAEALYYGAPSLIGEDLSGSSMILDEPFGNNAYERIVNFLGGPTISMGAKLATEGANAYNARTLEDQLEAGKRALGAATPYTRMVESAVNVAKGDSTINTAGKEVELNRFEMIMRAMGFTPVKQTKAFDEREAKTDSSSAFKLAKDIQKSKMPAGPVPVAQRESSQKRRTYEEEIRKTGAIPQGLKDDLKNGSISGEQFIDVIRSGKSSELENAVNGLSLKDALDVYAAGTAEEKKTLKPKVFAKLKGLADLPANERNKVLERFKQVMKH